MKIKRKLYNASEMLDGEVRRVRKENLHITLHFFGEKTKKEMRIINQIIENVSFKPFKVSIEGIGFFPSEKFVRVIWAGIGEGKKELQKLHESILSSLQIKEKERFVPHITLARANRFVPSLKEFKETYKTAFFGSFVVKEFLLVESHLGKGGARYEILVSYQGRDPAKPSF
jgi:2'-5' RNA ligase